MDSLNTLYSKVSPGGFVIIDDYNLPGCRRAVDEFRASHGIVEPINDVDGMGVYWQVRSNLSSVRYSVIVPTLWRSPRVARLFEELAACPEVNEIIVIDNAKSVAGPRPVGPKFRILTQEQNIFVNPSWNLGVREARNDFVCITNDDVNFDTSIFRRIAANGGLRGRMIGLAEGALTSKGHQGPTVTPITQRPYGWACVFFLHRADWIEIPSLLRIWCGDDYLFAFSPTQKLALSGITIDADISASSCSSEFDQIKNEDLRALDLLVRNR